MRLDIRGEYPADWPEIATRTRVEAGHRCIRCHHRFVPKRDAELLGIAPSEGQWTPCDADCVHGGPVRTQQIAWRDPDGKQLFYTDQVQAEWRVLTVHHLDGDKANCRWWNLLSLCQRCHLTIQGKVIPERPWLFEHTAWFRPYVAGFYAWYYGQQEITREEAEADTERWLRVGQPWLEAAR